MYLQLLIIKILLFCPFYEGTTSSFGIEENSKSVSTLDNFKPLDKISVRESNLELQVSVGSKIFVFGKAKGTLDKVKVGMNVLYFTQVPNSEWGKTTFTNVSWKKLKDGSIQIQSSYIPWPQVLTWTVFADGLLKVEASEPPVDFLDAGWLGLGFNYPDHALSQISWNSTENDFGQWKNKNFTPLSNPEIEVQVENSEFFQPILTVKLEFEEISIDVRTETSGIFLGLGQSSKGEKFNPIINSDLVFLFKKSNSLSDIQPQAPSDNLTTLKSISGVPFVLWFHFQ